MIPNAVYLLKMHETTIIGRHTRARRVPGGWIYTEKAYDNKQHGSIAVASITSVLVPFVPINSPSNLTIESSETIQCA